MDVIRDSLVSHSQRVRWPLFVVMLVIDVCLILSAIAQGTEATIAVIKLLH